MNRRSTSEPKNFRRIWQSLMNVLNYTSLELFSVQSDGDPAA